MSFLGTLAKTAGTIYDYATPGVGSSRLTDYGNRVNTPAYVPSPYPQGMASDIQTPPAAAPAPNYAAQNAALQRELARIAASYRPETFAPYYNITQGYAQARQQAQQAVSPLYQNLFNNLLQSQKIKEVQQNEAYKRNIEDLNSALQNKLETGQIERGRTAEDTATNLADVNTQEQRFQQDTGQQFEQQRLAAAKQGNAGSGLQQQQLNQFTQAANTQEGRQAQDLNVKRQQFNLLKTRTFEDLSRGEALAQKTTGVQKEREKFDLDQFLKSLSLDTEQQQQQLQLKQQADIGTQTEQYYKEGVRRFIDTLTNPAQRNAALKAYA